MKTMVHVTMNIDDWNDNVRHERLIPTHYIQGDWNFKFAKWRPHLTCSQGRGPFQKASVPCYIYRLLASVFIQPHCPLYVL